MNAVIDIARLQNAETLLETEPELGFHSPKYDNPAIQNSVGLGSTKHSLGSTGFPKDAPDATGSFPGGLGIGLTTTRAELESMAK